MEKTEVREKNNRRISFWPLPGRRRDFLRNTALILERVRDHNPTFEQLVEWATDTFGTTAMWTGNSIRIVILSTSLARRRNDGSLELTEAGQRYLDAQDSKVLLGVFLDIIWGLREILLWLKERNLNEEALLVKLKELGIKWKTSRQVFFRLSWLRAFGVVDKLGREYKLTDEGERVVGELISRGLYPEPVTEKYRGRRKEEERPAPVIEESRVEIPKAKEIGHNEVRDMISEIGKIEGKIAEVEYPIDNLRLDVIWKTIPTGNPKWAFEIQLAGNFYEALTKLKHAWDKWNSRPFLVTTEQFEAQAKWLLDGSFHEMKDDARIVNWRKIVELHRLLKEAHRIRREIRL